MSLAEILDNGAEHPWANIRINDLHADGSVQIDGGFDITGDLDINGGNLNVTPGEIRTNVIQPAVPNADLVVEANGIQVFDVQTSLSRVISLEVDSIDAKTPASTLQIGGVNANLLQFNDSLVPNADNTLALGTSALRFNNAHANLLFADTLNSESGNALHLASDTGSIILDDNTSMGANAISGTAINIDGTSSTVSTDVITSFTNNSNLTLTGTGTGVIALNKRMVPSVNNTTDLGETALGFRDMFLHNMIMLSKGTYAQLTDINTLVDISGAESMFSISTQAASTATTATDTFNVTNTRVLATSAVFINMVAYSGTPLTNGVPLITIGNLLAGSFDVNISNYGANSLAGTFGLLFWVV